MHGWCNDGTWQAGKRGADLSFSVLHYSMVLKRTAKEKWRGGGREAGEEKTGERGGGAGRRGGEKGEEGGKSRRAIYRAL